MKIRKLATIMTILSILSVGLVMSGPTSESSVGVGATPGTSPKKICLHHREVVDLDGINVLNYRPGQYAFTGEQLNFYLTVRDPNGMIDFGGLRLLVNGDEEVLCNPIEPIQSCDGLGEFNPDTDQSYVCEMTVEPGWDVDSLVSFKAYDNQGNPFEGYHTETWDFNPALSLTVETSDDNPISFESALPGEWAESTNHITVKNTASHGVNMWTYLAGDGAGLTDPDGSAKCPTTNLLKWDNVYFRAVSGSLDRDWTSIPTYNEDAGCTAGGPCYNGVGITGDWPVGNVLTNGASSEVYLKIHYPVPCVGSFTQGSLKVIAKVI